MKTWKDIRGEMLCLGGQGMERYEQDPALFLEAVNRAVAIITILLGEPLPPPITAVTPEDTLLVLSPEAAVIVPLLAAFYVWEDEDERKAVRWREDAYDLLGRLVHNKCGTAKIQGGWAL